MSEIVKSEYNALGEDNNYKTHYFKTSADQVVGLGRMKNTEYQVGNVVYSDTNLSVALKCITDGTTSADELDVSDKTVGESVADGNVVWLVTKRDFQDLVDKKADYRLASTAYAVGDIVACPYNAGLILECATAGTTSEKALDTTSVAVGDTLQDGGVVWTVSVLPVKLGGTGGTNDAEARSNLNTNLQTFTSLEQLGLNDDATEVEVVAAMPQLSQLIISFFWQRNGNMKLAEYKKDGVLIITKAKPELEGDIVRSGMIFFATMEDIQLSGSVWEGVAYWGSGTLYQYINSGADGYTKYTDGTLFQWGFNGNTSNKQGTLTFHVPFVNKNYIVIPVAITGINNTYITYVGVQYDSRETTNVKITSTGNVGFAWLAIGRWK